MAEKESGKSKQAVWETEVILELTLLPIFLLGDFLDQLFS